MIRNIVFDMGNVLLHYRPDDYLRGMLEREEDADTLYRELFLSQEWLDLDAGTTEEAQALEGIKARVEERLHPSLEEAMARWHEHLRPNEEMYALVTELKKKGYRLYLLSNASTRFHQYKQNIPALKLMDGGFISADVKLVKPHREVYEKLLERYGLKAEECCFVDDTPRNVEGAKKAGWEGIVFTGDVNALRRDLATHGIPV